MTGYTTAEAAALVGTSTWSLTELVRRKLIPAPRRYCYFFIWQPEEILRAKEVIEARRARLAKRKAVPSA
jgi:hypothetical protein